MSVKLDRIINGDCVKQLRKLDDGLIDLAFADPPFNIGYDYDEYDDKQSCDDYQSWCRDWIGQVIRVLKPDGAFWLAIGDEYAAELKVMATRELGLTCRSWVVWYYTFGVHCKAKFTRSHAHLFHFVRDPKNFTFNDEAVRVPSARQLVYGDKRANPKGRVPDDTWIIRPTPDPSWVLRPQDLPEGFAADSDAWYFSRVCGTFKQRKRFHGCQMPEQLLGRIIRACSNDGETVLDPFAGTGTTLAVAKKLGRQYLGIELSKQYATESRTRLRSINPGDPLDGPENPLHSAPTTANGTIRTADGKRVKAHQNGVIPDKQQPSRVIHRKTATARGRGRRAGEGLEPMKRGVIKAFRAVHRGFSVDWLLSEPELNAAFIETCRRLSLPGDAVEWNTRLLGLRKRSMLSFLRPATRAPVDNNRIRSCEFACEIALSQIGKRYETTLDGILSNPTVAKEYDDLASSITPGFEICEYRWAAMRLRKRAMNARKYAEQYKGELKHRRFTEPTPLSKLEPGSVPAAGHVYQLSSPGPKQSSCLYIGETNDLRSWVEMQTQTRFWTINPFSNNGGRSIQFQYVRQEQPQSPKRAGLQSYFVFKRHPLWNEPHLAKSVA